MIKFWNTPLHLIDFSLEGSNTLISLRGSISFFFLDWDWVNDLSNPTNPELALFDSLQVFKQPPKYVNTICGTQKRKTNIYLPVSGLWLAQSYLLTFIQTQMSGYYYFWCVPIALLSHEGISYIPVRRAFTPPALYYLGTRNENKFIWRNKVKRTDRIGESMETIL